MAKPAVVNTAYGRISYSDAETYLRAADAMPKNPSNPAAIINAIERTYHGGLEAFTHANSVRCAVCGADNNLRCCEYGRDS